MSRKTYSPSAVSPSARESETMGMPSCCARVAAASPSGIPRGPRMAMAPFCASCSTASAAASGSPRVSAISTWRPPRFCKSKVSAMPLRAGSAKALRFPVSGSTMPISVGLTRPDDCTERWTMRAASA